MKPPACRLIAVSAVIISILLISSCGEMESILPASRNYQVSASVENLAIDEYALVKQDDSVRPFFVYPLKGDPDAAAVSVSFTGAGGVQAGNSFLYILESARDEDQEADYDSVFILDSLSGTLPVFSIPGGLEPGPYTMVFQVFGRNQVLISRNKKNIFYMADEDYEIRDIRVYLPAFALPVHLIPPGTSVMLEASINAGADLDPYIVWYNGKSRINEGRAADGAARILWKVPSQTGFCNIRAEVIPFPPLPDEQPALNSSRQDTAYHGKTLELSLPVSARGELKGTFSEFLESAGSVLCDYRLAGNLADSAVQADSEIADDNYILAKVTNNADSGQPLWYPSAGVYGLLTGSDNIYRLPFEMPETGSAGKQLVFLVKFFSLNQGVHFGFSFGPESCKIVFARDENSLNVNFIQNSEVETVPVEPGANDDFCSLLLGLTFNEDNLDFSVRDEDGRLLLEKSVYCHIGQSRTGALQFGDSGSSSVMILGGLAAFSD